MQSRWHSKTAWIAVLALILFVSKTYLKLEIPEDDTLVNLILVCASALGIFNNPENKEKF
jgi:uncharacterized membrane protein